MFEQPSKRCSIFDSLIDGKRRFMKLYHILGTKFLCITILIEHVLQAFIAGGGGGGLIGTPILLLLSNTGLPATRIQVLETVAMSPWQLKPLIGILSDGVYVGGYNKMPYMIITALMGTVSAVIIALFYPFSPLMLTVLLFFNFLPIATSDLLLEGRYVEKTRGNPETRPTLYSFIHFCSGICQFLSIIVMGVLIMYRVPLHWLYLSPVLPFIIVMVLVYANWPGESLYDSVRPLTNVLCHSCRFREYASENDRTNYKEIPIIGVDKAKVTENWSIFLLAIIIGFVSAFTSVLGILELNATYLFVASLVGEFLMIGCFFLFLKRRFAKILTYVVIDNMCSVSLRAATFFFYTDPVSAYPEGPHFTRQFYVSVMGGLGIMVAILGVLIYSAFMQDWPYRRIFAVTSLLYMITCIPNILLFRRWNVEKGIPDTVFVLGTEVIQTVVGQLNAMPFGVLMLNLCPPGMESSLYAIMAGASNFGGASASYKGAALLEWLNVRPSGNMTGESAQFDNLWIASVISLCIKVLPIPFIWLLIPKAKQTEDLLELEEGADGVSVNPEAFKFDEDETSVAIQSL